jgi:phosphoribosylaminoimidazolecarboxamide formyltransferase/IMP cyclohydrolase
MGTVVAPDDEGTGFPSWMGASFEKLGTLRYGENPHQPAAVYGDPLVPGGLAHARQLHGKAMSYNNYVDADAAVRAAYDQPGPAVAVIKHANPCGIAVGATIAEAHRKAHATDPISAYGGVIASNGTITAEAAHQIADIFTEVVAAPAYTPEAIEILSVKKNLRLLEVTHVPLSTEWRRISGGVLVQVSDAIDAEGDEPSTWNQVAGAPVSAAVLADLAFAWRACRSVKSNAILLARDGAAMGIGMGQVNRVDSCRLAVDRAGADRVLGSVAASDAYFPFADGLQVLIDAGVRAVVSPGGSIRDGEVIAAAEAAGIALFHTGTRHFFH